MTDMEPLVIEGPGSACVTPPDILEVLRAYSRLLCVHAVDMARNGAPLADLVAFVIKDNEGKQDLVGVATRAKLPEILQFEAAPPKSRETVEEFLVKPVPPTHLRLLIIHADGLSCLRLDTVPMQPGGDA